MANTQSGSIETAEESGHLSHGSKAVSSDRKKNIFTALLRAAEQPTARIDVSLEMVVTGLAAEDHLRLSLNGRLIPESELKKMKRKDASGQRVKVAVDPRVLRFGDNTIEAAVKTQRKTFHVEIQWFALSVTPRP